MALLGFSLVAAFAIPAAAQVSDSPTGATISFAQAPSGDSNAATFRLPADVSFYSDKDAGDDYQAKPSPTHQMGGKQVTIDIQGGFITGRGASGLDVGVGASFLPMKDNKKFGIIVDGNYGHLSADGFGFNVLYISFNGVYNIQLQNSKAEPFVGGGLGIVHAGANGFGDTETKLQVLGGVGWNLSSGRQVNGQVRFVFTDAGSTTILLFGFAF